MSVTLRYQKDKCAHDVTVPFDDGDAAIAAYNELVVLPYLKWARINDDESGRLVRNYVR